MSWTYPWSLLCIGQKWCAQRPFAIIFIYVAIVVDIIVVDVDIMIADDIRIIVDVEGVIIQVVI